MPIWLIIAILIVLIIIYCFASKCIIKASQAPKEYEVNNRGEITYSSNQRDSYVQKSLRRMSDSQEDYKHPAMKYIRANYGRDNAGRKHSLNFNTQITYSQRQSPQTYSPILKRNSAQKAHGFNPDQVQQRPKEENIQALLFRS